MCFAKVTHRNIFSCVFIIIGIIYSIVPLLLGNVFLKCIILAVIWISRILLIKTFNRFGVYANDNHVIYYNNCKKRIIDLVDIKTIVIIKSMMITKYYDFALTDSDGQLLYTVVLLKEMDREIGRHYKELGDHNLMLEFYNDMLAKCIYENNIVEYLVERNPNIKVIDFR